MKGLEALGGVEHSPLNDRVVSLAQVFILRSESQLYIYLRPANAVAWYKEQNFTHSCKIIAMSISQPFITFMQQYAKNAGKGISVVCMFLCDSSVSDEDDTLYAVNIVS